MTGRTPGTRGDRDLSVDLPRKPRMVKLPARPEPIAIDIARAAIIIVDMQKDFCAPDGAFAAAGTDVTPNRAPIAPLARLLPVLRAAGLPVIWLNWAGTTPGGPPPQVVSELAVEPGDLHVEKHGFSGFPDTTLAPLLRELGVQTLLFAGVNIDEAVLQTLSDAHALGYETLLAEDCASTTNPDFCRLGAITDIHRLPGFTLDSAELIDALR